MQQERMHDVLLLLNHLVKSEEATVKLILDGLYDVASVNLINKKLQNRSLNAVAKSIARMSKPAFKIFALRWFQKNCPQLITDWLYLQVTFTVIQPVPLPTTIVSEVQLDSLSGIENTSQGEIKRLRSEVRYLAGISLGALAALATTVIWGNPQVRTIYSQSTSSVGICVPTDVKNFDSPAR
ncbi:hypothetical protein [Scytonema hofmannii]|uniref:hypothetical protein n=1 Tax=Scytonema hofmannii TaxID=34078 RepID=UPI00036A452E|nr:hypothetical protein [Scytonema hofmannii]